MGSTKFCGIRDQNSQQFWDQGSKFRVKKWEQLKNIYTSLQPCVIGLGADHFTSDGGKEGGGGGAG